MIAAINKWGNSLAVRIPNILIRELNLKNEAPIDIVVENGKIVIVPQNISIKEKIAEKFAQFEASSDIISDDYDWGDAVGDEVW